MDIAAALSVSRSYAYEVVRQMPRVKVGSAVRVSESAFASWLEARTVQPSPAPAAPARRQEARPWNKRREVPAEPAGPPIRRRRPRSDAEREALARAEPLIRPTRPRT